MGSQRVGHHLAAEKQQQQKSHSAVTSKLLLASVTFQECYPIPGSSYLWPFLWILPFTLSEARRKLEL